MSHWKEDRRWHYDNESMSGSKKALCCTSLSKSASTKTVSDCWGAAAAGGGGGGGGGGTDETGGGTEATGGEDGAEGAEGAEGAKGSLLVQSSGAKGFPSEANGSPLSILLLMVITLGGVGGGEGRRRLILAQNPLNRDKQPKQCERGSGRSDERVISSPNSVNEVAAEVMKQ